MYSLHSHSHALGSHSSHMHTHSHVQSRHTHTHMLCTYTHRPSPPFRTTDSVREACALVDEEQLVHYMGQYGAPLFCMLPNFSYQEQNSPDLAHMLANVFKTLVTVQVGRGSRGKFKEWNARKDRIHRAESELLQVFPGSWLCHDNPTLPWRLTPDELAVVDARVRRVVYPHHCETVGTTRMSFWRDTALTWKMSQKLLAFLLFMPTSLRGFLPEMHRAIIKLVQGIRILNGHGYSFNECQRRNIEPGCPCLKKADVRKAHILIVTALSMLEGCVPVCVYLC